MQTNPCALQAEGQGGRGEPQRQALWLYVEAGNESNGSPRGIMPHRRLKLKFNSLRPFSWTIFSGMVPFSWLFDRSRNSRIGISPNDSGMLPVSLLFEMWRKSRLEFPPKELGSWPAKLLNDNCNEWSFGWLPKQSGMSPDRLFLFRTRAWSWEDSGIQGIFPVSLFWDRSMVIRDVNFVKDAGIDPVNRFWSKANL